jgi:hypothetical protein
MAELHIQWADGRSEIRSLLPGQVVTVGNSWEPLVAEAIPIGGTLSAVMHYLPFCRVRLHGTEIPSIVLLTQKGHDLVLPSARRHEKRKHGRKEEVEQEGATCD